ncbi:MAG: flagellar basal body protein, partial [Plesiomonas shigelloides]
MSLINIGLTGLGAANAGLSTTSHNLVNMNTPGYTRQRIGLASQVG